MRPFALLLCLALSCLAASAAKADQFNPAYLNLHQTGQDTFDVLWKVPAIDETTTLKIQPVLPPGTTPLGPRRSTYASGSSVQRWQITASTCSCAMSAWTARNRSRASCRYIPA